MAKQPPKILNTYPSGETKFIQVTLTAAPQCRAGFESYDERCLAEQKSTVLTAETAQPAQVLKVGRGSGSVLYRSTVARHETSFYKLVEWSEPLRPVTDI